MKARYWVLIFAIIAALALAASWFITHRSHPDRIACVYSNGELVRTIDLSKVSKEYEFTIKCGGGYNTIYVSVDTISVVDSSCPDKICIHHGPLCDGLPIVCLPNKLVICWDADREQKYDAMTGI